MLSARRIFEKALFFAVDANQPCHRSASKCRFMHFRMACLQN